MHDIKIDSRDDGNLIPFKIFRTLFPKSTIEALCTTKNSVVLNTCNLSNIEQLHVYTVRHKYKIVRSRFFVMPGDGQALLGMPDIELLGILKINVKYSHAHLYQKIECKEIS